MFTRILIYIFVLTLAVFGQDANNEQKKENLTTPSGQQTVEISKEISKFRNSKDFRFQDNYETPTRDVDFNNHDDEKENDNVKFEDTISVDDMNDGVAQPRQLRRRSGNKRNKNKNRDIIMEEIKDDKNNRDTPRIYSLKNQFNLFKNFWSNRNTVKPQEELPVITVTTTGTGATGAGQNDEENDNVGFGTVTGTGTGTGTITAAGAEEIPQNNVESFNLKETPLPLFSFGNAARRQPIEYEILEEENDFDDDLLLLNAEYIDIDNTNELGKAASTVVGPQTSNKQEIQNPVKELVETPPKTGLEFYRQYMPNLQKLIEIRPKILVKNVNRVNGNTDSMETTRPFRKYQNSRRNNKRNNRRNNRRRYAESSGNFKSANAGNDNRIPVKRIKVYVL